MIAATLPIAGLADPQTWVVTAIAVAALVVLVRRALGPRRKRGGCASCAPRPRTR